jgi:hypothetical protein
MMEVMSSARPPAALRERGDPSLESPALALVFAAFRHLAGQPPLGEGAPDGLFFTRLRDQRLGPILGRGLALEAIRSRDRRAPGRVITVRDGGKIEELKGILGASAKRFWATSWASTR